MNNKKENTGKIIGQFLMACLRIVAMAILVVTWVVELLISLFNKTLSNFLGIND